MPKPRVIAADGQARSLAPLGTHQNALGRKIAEQRNIVLATVRKHGRVIGDALQVSPVSTKYLINVDGQCRHRVDDMNLTNTQENAQTLLSFPINQAATASSKSVPATKPIT
jgi:hypothetical protein